MAVDTRIRAGVVASACPSMSTVRGVTPSPAKLSLRPRWRSVIPPPPRLHSAQPMVVGTLRIGSLGAGVGEEDCDGFRGVMGTAAADADEDVGLHLCGYRHP